MGRRRRSRPKNPRRGPGHNEQNRQTRESRSRTLMLDASREAHFRYDVEQVLNNAGLMEDQWRLFIQTLWTRGNRQSTSDARDWLKEQLDEGALTSDAHHRIERLVDQYTSRR